MASPATAKTVAMRLRPSAERGTSDLGWLLSKFSFSFAGYWDPKAMGHGPLRVINEDRVKPGEGFGTHPHANMEIFSYILDGTLKHRDSMGNTELLTHGDVQFTSAGSGIMHSEFNGGDDDVRFLQMWVQPDKKGLKPRYSTKRFEAADKHDRLCPIVTADGADGSIAINQDVKVYASLLGDGRGLSYTIPKGRGGYLHVPAQPGSEGLTVNGTRMRPGDGLYIESAGDLDIKGHAAAGARAEFILFDLVP